MSYLLALYRYMGHTKKRFILNVMARIKMCLIFVFTGKLHIHMCIYIYVFKYLSDTNYLKGRILREIIIYRFVILSALSKMYYFQLSLFITPFYAEQHKQQFNEEFGAISYQTSEVYQSCQRHQSNYL